ncbi:MAG: hypothetical protein ACKO5E_23195, partial [bacterium]
TSATLALRVDERFPESGLAKLASELAEIARGTVRNIERSGRQIPILRFGVLFFIFVSILLISLMTRYVHLNWESLTNIDDPGDLIQAIQATIETTVFIAATIAFFFGWENRIRRRRAMVALHELRTLAHLVDIHQLNKTPDTVRFTGSFSKNSPVRRLTPFELARYFSYCTEMLSIVGKLAMLYVQDFPDPVVLQTVDQIEDLTTGLSSKIWEKSMLLTPDAHRLTTPEGGIQKIADSEPEQSNHSGG